MRWALVMMRLWAACRNTSVRRTTGTASDEIMSASIWPGPTEGSWSMSPTINRAAWVRHCLHERLHQHDIDHGGLVDNQEVAIGVVVLAAPEAATLGTYRR